MRELRHTQATMPLGNGVDVKTVQTHLGHSTSTLTLDQYAHAIHANDKAAADLMGPIYGNSATAHESHNLGLAGHPAAACRRPPHTI